MTTTAPLICVKCLDPIKSNESYQGVGDGTGQNFAHLDCRPDWNTYFLNIAKEVSRRGSCPRAKVGAVIVSYDNRILSTGYNGREAGRAACSIMKCQSVMGHCPYAIHAETNAIAYAAKHGIGINQSKLYVYFHAITSTSYEEHNKFKTMDDFPCMPCGRLIVASGILSVEVLHNSGNWATYTIRRTG